MADLQWARLNTWVGAHDELKAEAKNAYGDDHRE